MSPVAINGVDKQSVDVNGVQVKQALAAANSAVNKGVYDATLLETVDADLAVGNIKSAINIFGKVGSAAVLDVSDADALVTDVKSPKTFYSVTGPRKDGTMPTVTLNPSLNAYPAGYHAGDAGGLDAIDLDLASANIKSGVVIFGRAGAATVQEIGAADAAVTDVKNPRTFFSVTGAIKTGTMPTVALADANSAYPTGYHAGAANLAAIDAHLAVANIKTGVNIFGYVGTYDTTGTAPAVSQVILNRVCWANGVQITGTMATVALAADNPAYPAGYHAGAASLAAIDADLAVGNIKSGVNIFGYVGTYAPTVTEALAAGTSSVNYDAYTTVRTISIPAAAKNVMAWCVAVEVLDPYIPRVRVSYNGVVKCSATGSLNVMVPAQWNGAGVGAAADLIVETYSASKTSAGGLAASGAWYDS